MWSKGWTLGLDLKDWVTPRFCVCSLSLPTMSFLSFFYSFFVFLFFLVSTPIQLVEMFSEDAFISLWVCKKKLHYLYITKFKPYLARCLDIAVGICESHSFENFFRDCSKSIFDWQKHDGHNSKNFSEQQQKHLIKDKFVIK